MVEFMSRATRLAVGIAALLLTGSAEGQGGIFDLGQKRATRAVVTFGEALPTLSEHESDMTRLLAGVVADLSGREVEALRACVPTNPYLGDSTGAERIAVVHLLGREETERPAPAGRLRGEETTTEEAKRVEIVRTPDHAFIAIELGPEGRTANRAELLRDPARSLIMSWPQYRGGFDESACEDPRGEVFEVPKPYTPGWYFMDRPTMGERFLGRGTTNIDGTDRDLAREALWARLPRSYDPKTPVGLLIWVDAGESGKPPDVFAPALEELGLICIGAANSGNMRHVSSRYQLVFDALATASRRWHIDPRRVYLSGISGGGRVSSILLGCFPDNFGGAVPIVGLSHYERVPTGVGGSWAAGYVRPAAPLYRLLKERPIAPMTGRKDFNYLEITHAADLMRRDNLQVKVFGDPDMGHELPVALRFTEAITWVDRPRRDSRDAEVAEAEEALETYERRFGARLDGAARRHLVKVTEAGPWTPAAWKAVEQLASKPGAP